MVQRLERLSGVAVCLLVATLIGSAESAHCQKKINPGKSIHLEKGGALLSQRYADAEAASELPYHNGATLVCSDCHTVHASMQHNYEGTAAPEGNVESFPVEGTPGAFLLKASDPLDLCLTCHDNMGGIPDVVMADANGLTDRSAGFFAGPGAYNPRGHDLGRGVHGSDGADLCARCHAGDVSNRTVTCIDCHDPHGNGNPRNLQWASDPEGTPPLGLFNPAGLSALSKYESANTAYGTLNSSSMREVTNLCLDCHHVFTGTAYNDPDGDNIHSRHPSYESERGDPNRITDGALRGSTNPAHWDGGMGSGFAGANRVPFVVNGASDYPAALMIDASSNGVFCLSCHKAHGSSSTFGLVWETNGSVGRRGCDQCHLMKPQSSTAHRTALRN